LTAIEYVTGEIFESFFQLKLWDYSDNRFNYKGKVCLLFSTGWGILALIFANYIHPPIYSIITKFSNTEATILSAIIFAYLITDMIFSIISLKKFRENLLYLYERYSSLSNAEVQRIIKSFKRILNAFPDINLQFKFDSQINAKLKEMAGRVMIKLSENIDSILKERKPIEDEYNNIVEDILTNEEFLKLKNFYHHNSSIYEHAKIVSYISYRLCKLLNLDYVSAARGALLHDFFLYDWRNHDEPELAKDKYHGIEHPKIALENAQKHFTLNEIEKDIITKHMWPLTLIPPRYQESFIVTFTDKYVATKEFLNEFKNKQFGFKKILKILRN
ncbi:MAG TPA: hypothetical protein PKZ93_12055, partial [Spirochaetota bacterium]|nr:hypothetical protein [Spirochaetota bacterium]